MHTIRTLEDLFHAATNALSLISSHAQYLLGKNGMPAAAKEDLEVIHDVAQRTAMLLTLLPAELLKTPIPALPLLTPGPVTRTERTQKMADDGKCDR